MDSPLLTKNEHNEDGTIHEDSSSNDEQIVDISTHGDSSRNDEHIVEITTHGDSSSADEQPSDEVIQWRCPSIYQVVWILVELAMTLVQIGVAIFFLNQELKTPLFIWITCYKWASIATLPFVCLRLWQYSVARGGDMEIYLKYFLGYLVYVEYFFAFLVLIFLMEFLAELTSPGDSTQHFWLWFGLLAFSCIRYILPILPRAVMYLVIPVVLVLFKLWDALVSLVKGCITIFGSIITMFGLIVYACCCQRG